MRWADATSQGFWVLKFFLCDSELYAPIKSTYKASMVLLLFHWSHLLYLMYIFNYLYYSHACTPASKEPLPAPSAAVNKRWVFVSLPINAASSHTHTHTYINFANTLSPSWTGSREGKRWEEQEMMQKSKNFLPPHPRLPGDAHTVQSDLTKGLWKQEVV